MPVDAPPFPCWRIQRGTERLPSWPSGRIGWPGMFWTFVDATAVASGRVVIAGPQGHHLARVLRVRPGERGVAVSHGTEYEIEVVEAGRGRVVAPGVGDPPGPGETHVGLT